MTDAAPEFTRLVDLAAARLGGRAVAANDEFFAPKSNLLKAAKAVFVPEKYTARGKWMDGWETRRRRAPGHDWCVVRLGLRGVIKGFDVDTSFFVGNYPSHCAIEARDGRGPWWEVLKRSPLKGGQSNFFAVEDLRPFTELRLNIFPDGGVARLRAYGQVVPAWPKSKALVDLAAVGNGGVALLASDMFFSHPNNLLMPGRAKNMGDGWETKRRRGPGNDWVIIKLGWPGEVRRLEVDTNHFKGNYPDTCQVEGVLAPEADAQELQSLEWKTLLPQTKLKPHFRHFFERQLAARGPFSHLCLSIYPDGGVSRFRVHGRPF